MGITLKFFKEVSTALFLQPFSFNPFQPHCRKSVNSLLCWPAHVDAWSGCMCSLGDGVIHPNPPAI